MGFLRQLSGVQRSGIDKYSNDFRGLYTSLPRSGQIVAKLG
jgi:hypothetical protein